jgi:hypothetical protein
MDSKTLSSICSQVYQRFPEVDGCTPSQQSFPGDNILLIFKGGSITEDQRKMNRTVRVVVSPQGKIVKMTTSR